jgi:hypothetical protein
MRSNTRCGALFPIVSLQDIGNLPCGYERARNCLVVELTDLLERM